MEEKKEEKRKEVENIFKKWNNLHRKRRERERQTDRERERESVCVCV